MENQKIPTIHNPEVPDSITGKRELARLCIEIVQSGGDIPEGVTPRHVSQEVMVDLIQTRNRRSQNKKP
jgi:hypothetical protein